MPQYSLRHDPDLVAAVSQFGMSKGTARSLNHSAQLGQSAANGPADHVTHAGDHVHWTLQKWSGRDTFPDIHLLPVYGADDDYAQAWPGRHHRNRERRSPGDSRRNGLLLLCVR
jgi:hypothetical protein